MPKPHKIPSRPARKAVAKASRSTAPINPTGAVSAGPAQVDAIAFIARSALLYSKGELRAALEVATQGLAIDPDNAVLLSHRGVFAAALGDAAAAEDAYRHALAIQPDSAETHYNLGNLLKAQQRLEEAEAAYRRALVLNPESADANSNLGNLLTEQRRTDEAEVFCRRAIVLRPDYAQAHSNLGNLLQLQKRPQEAEAAYRRAIAVKPDYAEAYSNLGVLLKAQRRVEEAEAACRRAIALRQDYADAYSNLGNLLQALKRPEEAEVTYRHAIALKPDHADAHWNLSLLLLRRGRLQEGWMEFEARYAPGKTERKMAPPPTLPGGIRLPPQWQGEALTERSLLVWPEQGLGDEIQFARYLPLLKARGLRHLTLACKPPLKALFAAQNVADRVISTSDWRPEMAAEFDFWCYPLSLPLHFNTTLDNIPATIPYLTADPDRMARWAARLPQAKLRVGLVWKGSPSHKNDASRSLPSLVTLAPLWSVPGIAFVSLQKGSGEEEAGAPPANQPLTHLGSEIDDFLDSAAILGSLDLLICVDTAAAHLAGALGVPCWLLLPDHKTDWRWLEERTDSPWYPRVMRLFRQATDGDWDSVVARVVEALRVWISDASFSAARPSPMQLVQGKTSTVKQSKHMGSDIQLLPSAFVTSDGRPRFEIPIPRAFMKDAGAMFLVKHETEYGGYEYPTRKFLDEHLKPGDVFIDVGAHWGIFSLTAATRWPGQVSVWAMEPHPENVEMLRRVVAHNHLGDVVAVLPVAAGESAGILSLGLNSSMGHSLVRKGGPSIRVAVEPLDKLLGKLPSTGRIFLKIDAEGFEPEVLRGGQKLLTDRRLVAIIWEKGTYFDAEPGLSGLRDSLELLSAAGFSHLRFPDENAGGSLIEFKLNRERCNIFSLRDLAPLPCYEKPPGKNAPPVPAGPVIGPVADNPSAIAAANSPTPEIKRRHEAIAAMQTDRVRWSNANQLEPAWEKRAEFAARYIPAGARVLDLGCGAMTLEKHLPFGCTYLPCDVVARDARTRVCDFNRGEYPDDWFQSADVVVMLGVAEYIYNVPGLLCSLGSAGRSLLISYCPSDNGLTTPRRDLGWVNHYTREEFAALLGQAGFQVRQCGPIDRVQWLFHAVVETIPTTPPAKRVLVLSYNNVGNFGDRLGYHLIHSVLPPHAEVTHAHFNPWDVPADDFDLLVLGMGNSLFAPLLTNELLALLDRIPRKIGIFGTQYRAEIPIQRLSSVLDRLDHWYARYEEDILLYGRSRDKVTHLGDWLINAFPMTSGKDERLLKIGREILKELPLDRTIQKIQAHRKVYSTRLHPLLCALTSAEAVAYAEQRENPAARPSGKFRSMLLDVFGREMPEDQFWDVDRDAVTSYKMFVMRQTDLLRLRLVEALLK